MDIIKFEMKSLRVYCFDVQGMLHIIHILKHLPRKEIGKLSVIKGSGKWWCSGGVRGWKSCSCNSKTGTGFEILNDQQKGASGGTEDGD